MLTFPIEYFMRSKESMKWGIIKVEWNSNHLDGYLSQGYEPFTVHESEGGGWTVWLKKLIPVD